ncbi:MAG: AAA family ATPase [Spirochaetes bacterium]|nr:AAA family ATPase [Spirochaetota bacterium]
MKPKLREAFTEYGSFNLDLYFAITYNSLGSDIISNFPIRRSKNIIRSFLSDIDFDKFHFETIYKTWNTKDEKSESIENDLAIGTVYRSSKRKCVVHVHFGETEVSIRFVYDTNDIEAEKWVLETNHSLRRKYGEEASPVFKVLSMEGESFSTNDVKTEDFSTIGISDNYNDDFLEINELIVNSITNAESGVILLHGEAGTGKTTYIKHLIAKFKDTEFIFVQNEYIKNLLSPAFIPYLLKHRNSVLIIEDAEKEVRSRDAETEDSVVSTLLQIADGLFSDYLCIKILCTFNADISNIDKALLRKGRVIANYKFEPLTSEKAHCLSTKLGAPHLSGSLTLANIYGFRKKNFNSTPNLPLGFGKR